LWKVFSKGLKVAVVGRIQTSNYDDKEGKKHYVTEVVADEAYFADSKKSTDISPRPATMRADSQTDFIPLIMTMNYRFKSII